MDFFAISLFLVHFFNVLVKIFFVDTEKNQYSQNSSREGRNDDCVG